MAINYEFTAAHMYLFLVPTQLQLTQMLYVFKCMKVPWTKTVISIWYTQDRWMLKRSMCQWPTSQHYLWFAQKNVGIPIICSHCNFLWSLQRSQHFNLHKQERFATHNTKELEFKRQHGNGNAYMRYQTSSCNRTLAELHVTIKRYININCSNCEDTCVLLYL